MTDRVLQDWEKEMASATPNSLLRDIVRDNRAASPPQRPPTVSVGTRVHRGTKGWVEPRPMVAPRGNWLSEDEIKQREFQRLREKMRELDAASIAEQNDPTST